MSTITIGSYPQALWPGINVWWGRSYKSLPKYCEKMFDQDTSKKNYEEDVEATGFGLAPIKSEATSVMYDSEEQGTINRYTNIAYGLGFIVSREEEADNLYEEVAKKRTQALANSMHETKQNVAANVYNRGFSTSQVFGDGKPMLASDHPTKSGIQSNVLQIPADLSEAAIEDLCIQINKAKNSRGLRISLQPTKIIVPSDLTFEVGRILSSPLQNNTANNSINVLNNMGIIPETVVTPYLSVNPKAWFIRTNAPRGLIQYQREPIEFTMDNDFDTDNHKYKSYERYSFGISDWRGIYGSPGA